MGELEFAFHVPRGAFKAKLGKKSSNESANNTPKQARLRNTTVGCFLPKRQARNTLTSGISASRVMVAGFDMVVLVVEVFVKV